jgi:hypothetical protein
MRPTLYHGRCCQRNRSPGPPRLGRGHCSKDARVSRVSQALLCLGQILPQEAQYGYVTQSRLYLLLRRASSRPNSSADVGQTVFKVVQLRRQPAHGRLRVPHDCALHGECRADEMVSQGDVSAQILETAVTEGCSCASVLAVLHWTLCCTRSWHRLDPMGSYRLARKQNSKRARVCENAPSAPSSRPAFARVSPIRR